MRILIGIPLGRWLAWRFRITIVRDASTASLRPPFIVLANHVNFWDPFFLAIAFREPVSFLAADGNFRSRRMRALLALVNTIPKAKARTDIESIRNLQHVARSRGIVALFPEGQRTWDGATRPMLPATPKLVRLLRVPLVTVQLKGAYLSLPRWASTVRRGRLEIHVRCAATAEEVRKMSVSHLSQLIERELAVDEAAWQNETGVLFTAPDRATGAEKALFLCHACERVGTLTSRGATLHCSACGATTWFAPSGRLYATRAPARYAPHRFATLADWNRWQLQRLMNNPRELLPLNSTGATYMTGHRSRPLAGRGVVTVRLTEETMILRAAESAATLPNGAPVARIPVASISAVHVQYTSQLEFYAENRLHVLRITDNSAPAYLIEQMLMALHSLQNC